jgi:hypothetical protein
MSCIEFITPKDICEAIKPTLLPYLAKYQLENNPTLYDAIFVGSAFNGYKIKQSGLEVIIPVTPLVGKSFLSNDSTYQEQVWCIHIVERSLNFNDSFVTRKNLAIAARLLTDLFYNCQVIPKPQSFDNSEQVEIRISQVEVRDRNRLI